MRRFCSAILAAVLCFLLLCVPVLSFAAEDATPAMKRSERSLNSILSEESAAIRTRLFTEFVQPRLKYLTVRTASKVGSGKWIGSVSIAEELEEGEHLRYLVEECIVQYGYQDLPENTVSCTLTVGESTTTQNYDGQPVFEFEDIELSDTALTDDLRLWVRYYGSNYSLPLTEHYNAEEFDFSTVFGPMSHAYVQYIENGGEMKLVDHAVLNVKSYVADVDSETVGFIWELYLVHGDELPADATLLRYDTGSGIVKVYSRTLETYF